MKSFLLYLLCLLIGIPSFSQKRFVNIDGAKLWINTIGLEDRKEGEPLIVFENGHGTPMGNWDRVLADSSNLGPILTYDRPGVGESEPIDYMPSMKNVADRLLKLLDHLELPPPYLLVGHSLGGVYVRGFAVYHPEKLAGLVIIDPGDFTETQINKRDSYEILGWDDARIDEAIAEQTRKLWKRNENIPLALQRERQILMELRERDFKEILEHPLPNIPVHILVGGRFDMPKSMYSKEYDEEALFRNKNKHRIARWTEVIQSVDRGMLLYSGDAGHFVHWDDPDLAITSIKIVKKDFLKL